MRVAASSPVWTTRLDHHLRFDCMFECPGWTCRGTDVFELCHAADLDVFALSTEEFMALPATTQ